MWSKRQECVARLKCMAVREEGQDMVEYACVVFMISLGATAAIRPLAELIAATYTNIASTFISAVS
jgi:Flp pilus assembly pilin Flp